MSSLNLDSKFWSWFANTLQFEVLIHLVPKVLEPNKMDEQDDIHTAYAKLYKFLEKHKKLYRLVTKKLSDVELELEEISTKFDEANQTIGALRFENNLLAEKTKKLEAKLFQDRAQLERTSSAKLNEMLSFQKSTSDRTSLGYDFSSPSIASTYYYFCFTC